MEHPFPSESDQRKPMLAPRDRRSSSQKQIEEIYKDICAKLQMARESAQQQWQKWRAAPVAKDELAYRQAVSFRQTFTAKEGIEYGWVCEYAKQSHDILQDVFKSLDEKADSIIRHLTGGTGLFALGAIGLISRENAPIALAALPSLACALKAVSLAISARAPSRAALPPPVEGAVKYAESFGENAENAFLGQWHQTCEEVALAIARKGEKVRKAYNWYFWTIFLLVVAFVCGVGWKMAQPVPPVTPIPATITR
jgi:hypothetical protein